jgi:diketogulonate reductase-like aldo/keto reductase
LFVQEHMAFLPWAPVQNIDRLSTLTHAAERHGATPYQVALAWVHVVSSTAPTASAGPSFVTKTGQPHTMTLEQMLTSSHSMLRGQTSASMHAPI